MKKHTNSKEVKDICQRLVKFGNKIVNHPLYNFKVQRNANCSFVGDMINFDTSSKVDMRNKKKDIKLSSNQLSQNVNNLEIMFFGFYFKI